MEKQIQKYISLCARTFRDSTDWKGVLRHNRAMASLNKLAATISEDPGSANAFFGHLLSVSDRNVQEHAAVHCLKYSWHTKQAVCLLEQIMQEDNRYLALNAEFALMVWRGEVPGKKL